MFFTMSMYPDQGFVGGNKSSYQSHILFQSKVFCPCNLRWHDLVRMTRNDLVIAPLTGQFFVVIILNMQLYTGAHLGVASEFNMGSVLYTLNMDIAFGNGHSILNLLRGVSHSQIEFGVVQSN